jgi:hypothetical protein
LVAVTNTGRCEGGALAEFAGFLKAHLLDGFVPSLDGVFGFVAHFPVPLDMLLY